MINFGCIDDMLIFWSPPLDQREARELTEASTLLEFSQQRFAEVYLVTNFLERIGRSIHWTLEDSFIVIAQHFCILNVSDIDLYWPKYTAKEYRHRTYSVIRTAQLDFSDWLSYQACPPRDIPEYIIDIKFDELDNSGLSLLALESERSRS
jgi:hypothetical protein